MSERAVCVLKNTMFIDTKRRDHCVSATLLFTDPRRPKGKQRDAVELVAENMDELDIAVDCWARRNAANYDDLVEPEASDE